MFSPEVCCQKHQQVMLDHPQVPSDLVHREPLHCASAEKDGRVSERDPTGQTGPEQCQCSRMQEAAIPRDSKRQSFSQGAVFCFVLFCFNMNFDCFKMFRPPKYSTKHGTGALGRMS